MSEEIKFDKDKLDVKGMNQHLDEFMYGLDEAHHPKCDFLAALEGNLLEGSCNCGLQAVEEALANLEEKFGEII